MYSFHFDIRVLIVSISLILCLVLFAGCNNRENPLLPPNLAPGSYQSSNIISVYDNYLISSSNDKAFLYIPKTSIIDSLLNLNDKIIFSKESDLLSRDSLSFQDNTRAISATYKVSIIRQGSEITLESISALGLIYTDQLNDDHNPALIHLNSELKITRLNSVSHYGRNRIYFDIFSSGESALMSFDYSTRTFKIRSQSIAEQTKALLCNANVEYYFDFPRTYLEEAEEVQVSLNDKLDNQSIAKLSSLYPGYAIISQVLDIKLKKSVSSTSLAVVHGRYASTKRSEVYWMNVGSEEIDAWPNQGYVNGNTVTNWTYTENEFYSFIINSGKYFFLQLMNPSSDINIALDGSYNHIYFEDNWLDIKGINLPGYSLKLSLKPDVGPSLRDYFSGKPYNLSIDPHVFGLHFIQNSLVVESLPDDNWIEYGFRPTVAVNNATKLFRHFRSSTKDIINYKSYAAAYDEDHFSTANGFVYAGFNSSGNYLYADATVNSPNFDIPYLKAEAFIKTPQLTLAWKDTRKRSYSHIRIGTNPGNTSSHPWMQGEPLQLSNPKALLKIEAFANGSVTDALPANCNVDFLCSTKPINIINFNNSTLYPKLKLYSANGSSQDYGFDWSNGRATLYPLWSGVLYTDLASAINIARLPVKIYKQMSFVTEDIQIYLDKDTLPSASITMTFEKMASMEDPKNILTTQYSLLGASDIYKISSSNQDIYTGFNPLVMIKALSPNADHIFSVSSQEYYRVLPYELSSDAAAYKFSFEDGYYAFYPYSNACYAAYEDSNPHTFMRTTVSNNASEHIVSLYGAQFNLPQFFIPTVIPTGSFVSLASVNTVPGESSIISAYQLLLQNPSNQMLNPNFFTVPNSTQEPYIYIPFSSSTDPQTSHVRFRNMAGEVRELSFANEFSDNFASEYLVRANSVIILVNNPGFYYISP